MFWSIGALRHLRTDLSQGAHAGQVVSGHGQHKQLIDLLQSAHHHLANRPDRLRPAKSLFDQLAGWCGYGFTEGHAAAFALTGYRTGYLSAHHPAELFAGLMSHQPMGYYSANTLAGEVRRRGVQILPVDINASVDKCVAVKTLEIRLGFRMVSDMRQEDIDAILSARESRSFTSLLDFCIRVPVHKNRLENLILCGAFDSLHSMRRGLLWRLEERRFLFLL